MDYALRMIRTADNVQLRVILRVVVGRNIKIRKEKQSITWIIITRTIVLTIMIMTVVRENAIFRT